jgi:prespore-specific regulator
MKTRQDAWTEANDLLLAETVLRHIREGSTQLNAFEEVGDKLNRTSAACGFRWNAVVRDEFEKAIAIAKKQRKQRQRALNQKTKPLYTPPEPTIDFLEIEENTPATNIVKKKDSATSNLSLSMEDVLSFLKSMDIEEKVEAIQGENQRLKAENEELSTQIKRIENQMDQAEHDYDTIQQDYQSLVQIMDRARKMVLFEDADQEKNTFKMDRNGNLERIAK